MRDEVLEQLCIKVKRMRSAQLVTEFANIAQYADMAIVRVYRDEILFRMGDKN